MMLVVALSTLAAADIGADLQRSLPEPQALRCEVRLPMHPQGWNTVLAECDGRPVAIGAQSLHATNFAEARIRGAAQYADDMQQIYSALSAPPPPTPWWALTLAALLGAGVLSAVGASLSGPVQRLLRAAPRGLPPDAPMHP